MNVYFWGTCGSLPGSITGKQIKQKLRYALEKAIDMKLSDKAKIEDFINHHLTFAQRETFGVNTACLEIQDEDLNNAGEYLICDAGSGLRDFGMYMLKTGKTGVFNIFMSHLHWDHIQGFPFFVPAFNPSNTINIYGGHKELEEAFKYQQNFRHFPVQLHEMRAKIRFHVLDVDHENDICGYRVSLIRQNHPGVSYGYCFQKHDLKIVYSTDSEHNEAMEEADYPFYKFFKDADLLIFDAQYNLSQNLLDKKDWGHSSGMIGVDIARRVNAKRLCLFHNEHTSDDETLEKMYLDTARYAKISGDEKLEVLSAYDGLCVKL